ncbi:MAG: HAD-IA family hydrolase [Firmicutes bacterium]|nr:HAD-IA family hydrolase [Bacillota bacterium]
MQVFKAALFDVDGTILDTSEFIFQAYEHTLGKYALPPRSRAEIARLIGQPLEFCYQMLAPGANVDLLAATHRAFQAGHLHLAKPYPGANETLAKLKGAGIKVAAVTTRSRRTVVGTLEAAGLSVHIDYLVALEDVVNLKPDPEPVLKALHYLDAKPHESVMTGDTDVDVLAGKNAGTLTIGVTYGFHGTRIADSSPDYIIDSIEEIIPIVLPVFDLQELQESPSK